MVEVGRGLFDLPWKYHEEGDTITLDTVPAKQSQRLASKAIEAHTLSKIAQKIAEAPGNATVTLHDDGSRAQGAGLRRLLRVRCHPARKRPWDHSLLPLPYSPYCQGD